MTLTYRTGTSQDLHKLKELGLLSYGQFSHELGESHWEKMNSFLSDIHSYTGLLQNSTCFVCEDGEEIVGMAYLFPKGNPTDIFEADWSYIRMVGVHPQYGGNGIGTKLVRQCIELAIDNKEQLIALHTSEFMHAARRIYEKLGFTVIRELPPRFGKRYWLYLLDTTTLLHLNPPRQAG